MFAAPRLSLCMIVRDSSRTLTVCLDSIRPWVDEIIVVDTGSIDDSRQVASHFGAIVCEFPWCDDFSAARNESLRHATGDWIFWMDSDDTISAENGRKLCDLARGAATTCPTAYVMQVNCPGPPDSTDCTVVDHVKMFRNDERLRFEGRIHEQILPAIRRINGSLEWTDIYVTHSGAEHSPEAKRRKQQRDLRLLEMELAERPEHPFVLFNLGMTYADMDQPHTAAEYLRKSLLTASPEESHVRKVYALLVGCLVQMGDDAEARRCLEQGQRLFPDDAELHFRRGILEQHAGNHQHAVESYRRAIESRRERHFASRDRGITGHKARHNLAVVYREIGRLDLAELQWRLALSEQPSYRDGWYGLIDSLLDQRKYMTLEVEIEMAIGDGLPANEIAYAQARLSVQRGDIDSAIAILDCEIATGNEIAAPLRLKCQILFEHRPMDQAIAALKQLCDLCPEDGAVWHNLGTAYQKAGHIELAIPCFEKSLVIRPASKPTLMQLDHARHALRKTNPNRGTEKDLCDDLPNDCRNDQLAVSV